MKAKDTEEAIQASLDKPGAGIPRIEQMTGKIGLFIYAATHQREQALADFEAGAREALSLVCGLGEEMLGKRVMVPRERGMEDSSRFWSPAMIVQHLAIVDRQLLAMVRFLSAGRTSDRVVSTASVKPQPGTGREVIAEYEEVLASWREHLPDEGKLKASARHTHPWFGRMNAHQWMCMAVSHHRIHLRQLRAVLTAAGRS